MSTIDTHTSPAGKTCLHNLQKGVNSAFYIGKVFHKRLTPKEHQFTYPLYMTFLDVDEIDYLDNKYWWFSASRWAPLQLKASDYFRTISINNSNLNTDNHSDLKQSAISIAASLGAEVDTINRVGMLVQLRCFGIYFSPVNFFFLYEDNTAKYLLVEVSNTPWNKKHCYLVNIDNPQASPKCFHVSPFMNLDMEYRWRIKPPEKYTYMHIENWRKDHLFTAVFSAKRYNINNKNHRMIFLQWPIVTAIIVRRIYWQALKLFLKGIRYVPYQTQPSNPLLSSSHTDNKRSVM